MATRGHWANSSVDRNLLQEIKLLREPFPAVLRGGRRKQIREDIATKEKVSPILKVDYLD